MTLNLPTSTPVEPTFKFEYGHIETKLSCYELQSNREAANVHNDNIDCRNSENGNTLRESDQEKVKVTQLSAKQDKTKPICHCRVTYWSFILSLCQNFPKDFVVKEYSKKSRQSQHAREYASLMALQANLTDQDNISVPKVYAVGESKDYLVIIMEYVPGVTLKKVLEFYNGKMPEPVLRSLARSFMDFLKLLNRSGVFHLDIKSLNVIVRRNTDFQFSKMSVKCESDETETTTAMASSSASTSTEEHNELSCIDFSRKLTLCFIDYDLSVRAVDSGTYKSPCGTPSYTCPKMVLWWVKYFVKSDKGYSIPDHDQDMSLDVVLDSKWDFPSVALVLYECRSEAPYFPPIGSIDEQVLRRFEREKAKFNWNFSTPIVISSEFLSELDKLEIRLDETEKWFVDVLRKLYLGQDFNQIDESFELEQGASLDSSMNEQNVNSGDNNPFNIPSRNTTSEECNS